MKSLLLSYLHFFCAVTYAGMAVCIILKDWRALISRLFAVLFLCFAGWSLAFTFVHNPQLSARQAQWFLNFSSLGGVCFILFTFWSVLAFTGRHSWLRNWRLNAPLAAGAMVFIIAQWSNYPILAIDSGNRQSYGWDTILRHGVWTNLYYLYSYGLACVSLYLLFFCAVKDPQSAKRRQAWVISVTGLAVIAANTAFGFLSEWHPGAFPHISDMAYLLWTGGILFAMYRYELFSLTPSTVADKIIETMSDALLITDMTGRICHVNSAGLSLIGIERRDIINKAIDLFIDDKYQSAGVGRGAAAMNGVPSTREALCVTSAGTVKPVLISSSLQIDESKTPQGRIYVIRDMTDLRRRERDTVEAIASEQLRTAHDLHDGLGQHLTGLALQCKLLERVLRKGDSIAPSQMAEITRLTNQATEQVHSLSKGLSPVAIGGQGLADALQGLALTTRNTFGIPCTFIDTSDDFRVNDVAALHLYRIAQEAITNAAKHGQPGRITISLEKDPTAFVLAICHDGKGMPGDLENSTGLGLRIMHYRARTIGGMLQIESRPDAGVIVRCLLPVAERGPQ